jgi:uncharacterized membrane protein
VSFATITLCVASQRVFIVVYFVIDSVRKLLDTHSYMEKSVIIDLAEELTSSPDRNLATNSEPIRISPATRQSDIRNVG